MPWFPTYTSTPMIQLTNSNCLSLWFHNFIRIRTSLPKLKVQRSSFQHFLHLLNWKSFGFWYKDNDKDNSCNSDEYKYHECV